MRMMNKGIIAINKPQGWTSFDVVNKVKHLMKIKRVGHLGTLDPMATGVLLVTFGSATKLFDLMQEKVKTYVAVFQLGTLTDTLDATGEVIEQETVSVSRDDLARIVPKFIGSIDQIPPKYSAKSVNGVRAYDLARQNIEFELKAKRVEIYSIKVLDVDASMSQFTLEITCGSGTYIRALGRDIANALGTYATMTSLVRTRVGNFDITKAVSILDLNNDNIEEYCLSLNECLSYDKIDLAEHDVKKLLNGQTLILNKQDNVYKLVQNNDIIALVKVVNNHAKMSIYLG